jgi:hypothetical protein
MVLHGKVTPGDFRIREHHVNDVSNKVVSLLRFY